MSEIKTCEDYVVARLQKAEAEIETLKNDKVMLLQRILETDCLIKVIAQEAELKKSAVRNDEYLISFDYIWEGRVPEFDKICKLLGLKKETEADGEESAE